MRKLSQVRPHQLFCVGQGVETMHDLTIMSRTRITAENGESIPSKGHRAGNSVVLKPRSLISIQV